MKSYANRRAGTGRSADLSRPLPVFKGWKRLCGVTCLTVWVTLLLGSIVVWADEAEESFEPEWIEDTASVVLRYDWSVRQATDSAVAKVLRKMRARFGEEQISRQMSMILEVDGQRSRSRASTSFSRSKARELEHSLIDQKTITADMTGMPVQRGRLMERRWVKVRAKFVEDTTRPDITFSLTGELNRTTYREFEAIWFRVYASQDCYLTVFAFYQDGSMALIFPDEPDTDNKLKMNETVTIPSADCGWEMRARLKPGQDRAREGIIMVVTKRPVPFRPHPDRETYLGFEIVRDFGLEEYSRWLGPIPIDQSTQVWLTYEISK